MAAQASLTACIPQPACQLLSNKSHKLKEHGVQLVPAVTELILAEMWYLQVDDDRKPINFYINSTGTTRADGETVRVPRAGLRVLIAMLIACLNPQSFDDAAGWLGMEYKDPEYISCNAVLKAWVSMQCCGRQGASTAAQH